MVGLGLGLLTCANDVARKNAALYLANGFQFRVILEEFDRQVGGV
jgi:sRNA-binding regulator protein Hfq